MHKKLKQVFPSRRDGKDKKSEWVDRMGKRGEREDSAPNQIGPKTTKYTA